MPRAMRGRFHGQHALITGGSAGIGLSIAKAMVEEGASVTVVARTQSKLDAAVKELQELVPGAIVGSQAADTSDAKQVAAAVAAAEAAQGPVDVLVANAGFSTPGHFHELDISVFEKHMRVNYLGTVATVQAVYPSMVARKKGHICIVSSATALLTFTGYSAYAPTKAALKALADTLRNELQGSGVRVSIAYPPDVDTPGFKEENKTKPEDCHAISDMLGSLFPSDVVGRKIVRGLAAKKYVVPSPDFGLNLLADFFLGLAPRGGLSCLQVMLLGWVLPLVMSALGWNMDRISRKAAPRRFAKLWVAPDRPSPESTLLQ